MWIVNGNKTLFLVPGIQTICFQWKGKFELNFICLHNLQSVRNYNTLAHQSFGRLDFQFRCVYMHKYNYQTDLMSTVNWPSKGWSNFVYSFLNPFNKRIWFRRPTGFSVHVRTNSDRQAGPTSQELMVLFYFMKKAVNSECLEFSGFLFESTLLHGMLHLRWYDTTESADQPFSNGV